MSFPLDGSNTYPCTLGIDGKIQSIVEFSRVPIKDGLTEIDKSKLLHLCKQYWEVTLKHVRYLDESVRSSYLEARPKMLQMFLQRLGLHRKSFIVFLRQGTAYLEIAWREREDIECEVNDNITWTDNDLLFYAICRAFRMVVPEKPISDGTAFRYCMELIKNVGLYHLKEDNGEVYDYRADRRKVLQSDFMKPVRIGQRFGFIKEYMDGIVLDEYKDDAVEGWWTELESAANDATDIIFHTQLISESSSSKSYLICKLLTYIDLLNLSLSENNPDLLQTNDYRSQNEGLLTKFFMNNENKALDNRTKLDNALCKTMSPEFLLECIDQMYKPILDITESADFIYNWLIWYRFIMSDSDVPYSKLKHICIRSLQRYMYIFLQDTEGYVTKTWLDWYREHNGGDSNAWELHNHCDMYLKKYNPASKH